MHVNCIGTVISKYSDFVVYIRTCYFKTSTCNNCTNQFSYKAGQQISSVLSVFSVLIFPPTGVTTIFHASSIGAGLVSFQDGRHSSKMAAMAPIQAQMTATTSDDPVTRSVSPRRVS